MDIKSNQNKVLLRKNKKKAVQTDGIIANKKKINKDIDWGVECAKIIQDSKKNTKSLLLNGYRTSNFVTQDSRRYITSDQIAKRQLGYKFLDIRNSFDSVGVRYIKVQIEVPKEHKKVLISEFRPLQDVTNSFNKALAIDLSPVRTWQVSLAGAVLFGMVSMSMIYHNFGQYTFAQGVQETQEEQKVAIQNSEEEIIKAEEKQEKQEIKTKKEIKQNIEQEQDDQEEIKEIKAESEKQSKEINQELEVQQTNIKEEITEEKQVEKVDIIEEQKQIASDVTKIKSVDSVVKKDDNDNKIESDDSKKTWKEEAKELVKGYPIEKMLPYILEQDPEVAKYLIAIAKQESAWGKRVPVLNGQDCYNYWGYRGKRKFMGSGGHTCFNSRKDAVETVGKRIHDLIYEYDRKTADKLIVWKCGSSCAGHSQEGVQRWIGVVDTYYDKLSNPS